MAHREDLLEQGIPRFLSGAVYESVPAGYARICHVLPARRFPRHLPADLDRYVRRPNQRCPNQRRPKQRRLEPAPAAGSAGAGVPLEGPDATATGESARVVVMDIESLGFIGSPVFLIGALYVDVPHDGRRSTQAELVQYFARDYSEEEAILRAFGTEASGAALWITYNGASFDLPFLELRATQHRLSPYAPARHLDLLPVARRLWSAKLPNCKLKTIEHYICGRPRGEDIEGARIPPAYHAYVRSGEPLEMLEVLRHNVHDLTSLLEMYLRARTALGEIGSDSSPLTRRADGLE